jgi:hypothetical protein
MADAPIAPYLTPLLNPATVITGGSSGNYPDFSGYTGGQPKSPADQYQGARSSIYGQSPDGTRANLISPDWLNHLNLVASAAYNPTDNIDPLSITATMIADNAITTPKLIAGAVIASKINVTDLSAISANLGTVTAGTMTSIIINGGTITGSTFQTATGTGARIDITTVNGIRVYDASNTVVAQLLQTGISGSYFVATVAAVTTEFRTNSIVSGNGSGAAMSIFTNVGGLGGSAEVALDGSGAAGTVKLKTDGTTRLTVTTGTTTLNSGGFTITSGSLLLSSGNVTLTSGNVTITSGTLTVGGTGSVTGKQFNITNTGANSDLIMSANAGQAKEWVAQSAAVNRWIVRAVNDEAESGADAGANYDLVAYTDAGAVIDIPFKIFRIAGGAIQIKRPITTNSTFEFTTAQTVVLGNVGGDITATEMFTGAASTYKSIIIRVRNFSLTAVYTFQNAFVAAPLFTASAGITVTPTTTQVTVTTAGLTNGWVKLEGY